MELLFLRQQLLFMLQSQVCIECQFGELELRGALQARFRLQFWIPLLHLSYHLIQDLQGLDLAQPLLHSNLGFKEAKDLVASIFLLLRLEVL